MKNTYLFLVIAVLFGSCSKSHLTVQTDYLTHKDLASYFVDTPDPRQNVTSLGQRLIICWSVPKNYLRLDHLHLEVTIRFRNRDEVVEIFHLSRTRGTYVFSLLNADYLIKKGILTYKVNLIGGGCILEAWRHQIWTELISMNQTDANVEEACNQEMEEEYPVDWEEF